MYTLKEIVMSDLDSEILEMDTSQPGAEDLLLEYSRHEDMLVRSNALEMLWEFESDAVAERMGEILEDKDEDELVVVEALEWVGINEMVRFYPIVLKLLDDPADLVRSFAALALIDIGTKVDISLLEDKLAKAPDEDKPTLLFTLANLGDANRYVDEYLAFLKHDDWLIRRSVAANAANLAEIVDPKLVIEKLEEALEVEAQEGNILGIRDALKKIAEQN